MNGQKMRGAGALLAIAVSSACQSDRRFHVVAVYEAPNSGCSVRMEARGVVRSGRDLSDQATATVTFGSTTARSGSAGRAPVTVHVALDHGRVLFGDEFHVQRASEGADLMVRVARERGLRVFGRLGEVPGCSAASEPPS